ncbi:unnamed protein product, partial [Medioppia subpectinata]
INNVVYPIGDDFCSVTLVFLLSPLTNPLFKTTMFGWLTAVSVLLIQVSYAVHLLDRDVIKTLGNLQLPVDILYQRMHKAVKLNESLNRVFGVFPFLMFSELFLTTCLRLTHITVYKDAIKTQLYNVVQGLSEFIQILFMDFLYVFVVDYWQSCRPTVNDMLYRLSQTGRRFSARDARTHHLLAEQLVYGYCDCKYRAFVAVVFILSPIVLTIVLLWQKWTFWKRQGIPTDWSARSGRPFHIADNECHKKHGKVVGFYEGLRPCLSITDPELIRKVLVTNFHHFPNHRELTLDSEPMSKGLFLSRYPLWKRMRALHATSFTTGRIKAMLPIMSDTFERLATLLDPKARDSQVVDFRTVYDSFTFDVITRAVAGADANALDHPDDNPLFTSVITMFQNDQGVRDWLVFYMPFLRRFVDIPFFDPKKMQVISDTVDHVISERVANDAQVPDFLQHSVNASVWADTYPTPPVNVNKAFDKLTKDEVIGQAINMLGAGHETTASQLCLITRILALKPWYQTKLVHEIHNTLYTKDTNELSMDYEKLQKMPLLDAFIKEVMRLNCSVSRVDRMLTKDMYLEGIYLPKGTSIVIPIWALHLDPDHFADPDEFKPERFLQENLDDIKPYTYLPFSWPGALT